MEADMKRVHKKWGRVLFLLTLTLLVTVITPSLAAPKKKPPSSKPAQESTSGSICFWSAQGPVCAVRRDKDVATQNPEKLISTLLEGPTDEEQAQGLWSTIPEETTLADLQQQADGTVIVYLEVPAEALRDLDHESFEIIVHQISETLAPLNWRDLRIQTRDPATGEFVPLAKFLPEIPAPRKETLPAEEKPQLAPAHVGQPPAPGPGQPQGGLSGKTVYVSAGHGWRWNSYVDAWRTQRPPYPNSPYEGPIIEDHNNAEATNQYLLHYLWNAGAQVWPARERDMNSQEVIVDNDVPASDGGYLETGSWATTSFTGTGYAGTNYHYTKTVTDTPTATAVWTATLPADGRYAVYVWYRPGENRAPDAHYTVHHAGGETKVTLDQRRHGITWRYVGTYGFQAAEEARVTLTNQSAVTGSVVVADAVRFGGGTFDDLTDVETEAPQAPDKPWWETAAFYYTQRMGMEQPPGDVTARPIYARWEHAGTGDDAVYVSWHTNGATGYQTWASGTETYVHNGEWLTRTEGSLELRHAIHSEVVQDIRAGWDTEWSDRGEKQKNLGELRLLWDEEAAVRMPGALIEIAFHDHPEDTDALKEPTFNMLAARAVYQGIVKYFEQRDGVDLTLLPEPPTHLAAQNVGGGRVRISWRPSPTDTLDLAGDPATGYRIYTSTDGLGWSNGVPVTGTTAYTLTNLSPRQLILVRVTGANEGGESFPSETLAARVGEGPGVLLVNGFDRLDRWMLWRDYDPVEGENRRMFLDQMNRYDYAVQHGTVISYPFDSTSNEALSDTQVLLGDYAVVDWILGEESSQDETLSEREQALLQDFLDNDGALFISGPEIGWDLDHLGSESDRAFYNDYLRAEYVADDAQSYDVVPAPGSIFEDLSLFRFDAAGMYAADYPDQITATNGSRAALSYYSGFQGTAAVQHPAEHSADGCERLIYLGFPFETIRPEQRAAVMARAMGFLDECMEPLVETNITAPQDGSAHRILPPFEGTSWAEIGEEIERVETQIERASDGTYWDETDWVTGAAWLSATGTEVWSYTLPSSLPDDEYHLRARAWTVDGVSDTSPAEVGFIYDTTPPSATTLITPTGGLIIPTPVSVTLAWEPVAPDGGSALAYRIVLDDETHTTTRSVYTASHITGGTHVWGVQVFDAAGNHSAWVTDTFHYPSLDTRIDFPPDGSAHRTPPPFEGEIELDQAATLERVEVQLQRASDDRYWTGATWVSGTDPLTGTIWLTKTVWLTATGDVFWSYPLTEALTSDDGYALRARAWTTTGEVDRSPAEVSIIYDTIPPTATTLITPTGEVTVTGGTVRLAWEPIEAGEGSALAYRVKLDERVFTTTHTTYTITQVAGGPHTWGVQVIDAAGNRSGWITDTFFIAAYNVWLPLVTRNYEADPALCEDVISNGGFESDAGWTLHDAAYTTTVTYAGIRSALVGIPPGEPGGGALHYSSVRQEVTLTPGSSATLRLWAYPIHEGGDPDDMHYVTLFDEWNGYHTLDTTTSDAQTWGVREYDLSAYASSLISQTVTLYVGARNDGDDDTAAMYVDEVVLEVCP